MFSRSRSTANAPRSSNGVDSAGIIPLSGVGIGLKEFLFYRHFFRLLGRIFLPRTQSAEEGDFWATAFFECSDCRGCTSNESSINARIPKAAAFAAESVVMQGILYRMAARRMDFSS